MSPPNDRYSSERYNPNLSQCTSLSLHFDGTRLEMRGGTKQHSYLAVSGTPNSHGNFDYSPAGQRMRNAGPIPAGVYWIRPDELWENAWYKRAPTSAWGDYRITIHPFTTTTTFGRGGFFIHGGSVRGSIGCIDLTINMNTFALDLIRESGLRECQIHLTVDYS